jgi:hypothetical protein
MEVCRDFMINDLGTEEVDEVKSKLARCAYAVGEALLLGPSLYAGFYVRFIGDRSYACCFNHMCRGCAGITLHSL